MSDLISRQAAIDKVYRLKTRIARRRYVGITDEVIDMLDDLIGDIDDMPTAELVIPVKQITDAIVDKYVEMAMPSADAVEAVRCDQCRHFEAINNDDHGWCKLISDLPCEMSVRYDDDFCSYGERIES